MPPDFHAFKYALAKPSISLKHNILHAIFPDKRYTSHLCTKRTVSCLPAIAAILGVVSYQAPALSASNPAPLPDLYFDSFSYPVASIVLGDMAIVSLFLLLFF